ncbi:MAG: helix-turn-helix transcriptional regulator [Devosia sp.]
MNAREEEQKDIPSPLLRAFAINLRRARKGAGLTQRALADRVGVTQQYVGRIECGVANTSLNTLGSLAEALGVEATQLLSDIKK